jgi:hypothetical protein
MLERVQNDVSYVGLCCLDYICFTGEFQPLVYESLMVFRTSFCLSNTPTGLSILLSVSTHMLSLYGHASLLAVSRGLSLSSSFLVPLAVAAALGQLTISATYEASNP